MLGNFMYCNPTKLYFGEDSLASLNEELPKYGQNVQLVSRVHPPLKLKEVRHKYRQCDCGQLGLFQFGHDKPHAIASFAQAESPLHRNPVCIVLIFLFLALAETTAAGLPRRGPERRIPCSLQYLRLSRVRYIWSARTLSG